MATDAQTDTGAPVTLEQVVAYARQCGLKSMASWPEPVVREYLEFHRDRGSLAVTAEDGRITGLAIGWQVDWNGYRGRRERLIGESPLEYPWTVSDPAGGVFYFANLAAETGEAVRRLVRVFEAKVPRWRELLLVARRRGTLQVLTPRYIERLVKWASGGQLA